MPETIATSAAINITADGIAIENAPLVAGERVPVTASGLALADGAALTLVLEARAPTFQIANVALVEDAETGVWSGTLETATRQAAVLFATAGADESRPVVLELIDTANRDSLAILPATLRNSALIPAATPCAVGPVYLPVPGPPGEQGPPGDPRTPSDTPPAMDGAAFAGSSAAYARGDHRHPVDTSRAAASDIALNAAAYSDWAVSPVTYEGQTAETSVDWNEEAGAWILTVAGDQYLASENHDATSFTVDSVYFGIYQTVTGTRSATAFRLGPDASANPNREKTLAPAGDYAIKGDIPAVVAPSTSAADAGKAADAKATGDALAGKVSGTDDGTTIVLPSGRSFAVQGNIMTSGSIDASDGSVSVGGLYVGSAHYSAETWTFTLDDDSTVQKQILVAPVAAQGGA